MFKDCFKNRLNCVNIYKPRYAAVGEKEKKVKELETKIQAVLDSIKTKEKQVANLKSMLSKYQTYPNMYEDLPDLAEVGKPVSEAEVAAIFKSSWGVTCIQQGNASFAKGTLEMYHATKTGLYRPPMDIFKLLIAKSLVDQWDYLATEGLNPMGVYACNDFATSLFCETKAAPKNWGKMFIGIICVTSHRINVIIPKEEDKVYYVEPQTDGVWFPDFTKETEKKPFLVIA